MADFSARPRYRARESWPTAGGWFEVDEFRAKGLFLDEDFEVQPLNEAAGMSMWGSPEHAQPPEVTDDLADQPQDS